jgi:hypothetical protein
MRRIMLPVALAALLSLGTALPVSAHAGLGPACVNAADAGVSRDAGGSEGRGRASCYLGPVG